MKTGVVLLLDQGESKITLLSFTVSLIHCSIILSPVCLLSHTCLLTLQISSIHHKIRIYFIPHQELFLLLRGGLLLNVLIFGWCAYFRCAWSCFEYNCCTFCKGFLSTMHRHLRNLPLIHYLPQRESPSVFRIIIWLDFFLAMLKYCYS